MDYRRTHAAWRATALACLLAGLLGLALALARATPVAADGLVTDCSSEGLNYVITSSNGLITFDCGPIPVIISVAQAGGFNILPGKTLTIDGGDKVTLSGANAHRIFDVRVGGALTLTNIILTQGRAVTGGNLQDLGGAILAEGVLLTLDHVTIRNSMSDNGGGGIEIITGTVLIKDSLIEGNHSLNGGGIDNGSSVSLNSTLRLTNTTVRNNSAWFSGGGLNLADLVYIDNSQIYGNEIQVAGNVGGGGLTVLPSGSVDIRGSQLHDNQTPTVSNESGGAIQNYGSLTVTASSLISNTARRGGGIANYGALLMNQSIISGNSAVLDGGGMFNHFVAFLANSTMAGNHAAQNGGGIASDYFLNVSDSTIADNHAVLGGGAYVTGTTTLYRSTLSLNGSSSTGAGVFNTGQLYVSLSTFRQNGTTGDGGAIFNSDATTYVYGSTLDDNSARDGGGAWNYGDLTMINSTLSANQATRDGGGIYNFLGSAQIYNTTIVFNGADSDAVLPAGSGGGVFTYDGNSAITAVRNTLIAGNNVFASPLYDECAGTVLIFSINLVGFDPDVEPGCTLDATNGFWTKLNTLNWLGPLQNNGGPTRTHALLQGSNAIDSGISCIDQDSAALPADQRGVPRVIGAFCDIGAFEYRPPLYLPLLMR